MNRNPYCSGKRPEEVFPVSEAMVPLLCRPVPGILPMTFLARGLMLAAIVWASAFMSQTALAAKNAKTPALPNCPKSRELCVQAERSGGIDLKTGVAHLEGNVVGLLRSRKLRFNGQSLKAFRGGGKEWVRLVLDGGVRIRQPGRDSSSDHSVLEKGRIRLSGNVRIVQKDLELSGKDALLESRRGRTVVRGDSEKPMRLVLRRGLVAAPGSRKTGRVETVVTARKAVLEDKKRRIRLSGKVRIEQSDGALRIQAEGVVLNFSANSSLASFRAGGRVSIAQPGRVVSADRALSKDRMHTILLIGNATMLEKGQFELKAENLEVYTDSRKGILRSPDRKKPITLTLDFKKEDTHQLTQAHLTRLSQRGVPPLTLEKLGPLLERKFKSRPAFQKAVDARLSRPESRRYLSLIMKTAR